MRGWNSIIALQFENLICNNLEILIKQLGIAKQDVIFANPYFQRKTARQDSVQIDYLIHVKHETLYLCEIKFSRHPVAASVIDAMKLKAKKLALPKHISIRFVLIHVNGVSDDIVDAQLFQHIIDFGQFLK